MAKDQELLQAVKSNDLGAFRKLSTKIKAAKTRGRKEVPENIDTSLPSLDILQEDGVSKEKGGKKYNVNIQDDDGFTASHHAALTGSSEVVIGLIELESDINSRDHKGMSPLHLAAWSGKVEVARLLVEAGAHVNASSDNGDTPLILACQHGNSDVADVLLDKGCNSWSTNKSGESALDLACRFGHVHVVELLLKSKEIRSILTSGEPQKSDPPLHLASKAGHMEIVRMLLEVDADLNHVTSRGTCLHEAALYGKTEVVKLLLEWGIDANAKNDEGHTALDVVNLYTSSKASSEIKQLLKDAAAADSTVYAKAVRDHFNMLDSTALSFKTGDAIIVLEQNQNERWKGKVQNGEKEKVGYFPGNFVRLISPRRGCNVSGKKSPKGETIVPKESYETIALAPASPSEFKRNSPRLSSFGKKGPRHRDGENGISSDSPAPKKALIEPALLEKGLKAKKPSVKLGTGLQYVEVAVDKVPLSPPQTSSAGGGQTTNKTQYAEVLLPPNGSVEEAEECEDVPTLPRKNSKRGCAEDIWVRNTAAHPLPSLPPKTRSKGSADDFERSDAFSGQPRAPFPHSTEPAGASPADVVNPASQSGGSVSQQASQRVASPDLSRIGYEVMTLSSVSGGRATPPAVEDIWKPQPVDAREHRKQQPAAYENVCLPNRGKPPNDMPQSMVISDVDQPAEGDDGYVVINQQPSKPTDPRGYENVTPASVTPGYVTQGAVTSGSSTTPVRSPYENVINDGYYMRMRGGVPDAKQTGRKSNEAAGEHSEKRNSSDSTEENKDAMDYEMMKSGAAPVNHQYVNIKRQDGAANPVEPSGNVPLKMRDYNALYDWLEKFKLAIYIDNFVKGGFDMTSVFGITAEDLTAINVKKTGHRKKILSESAKLEGTTVFPREKPKDIMTWLRLIGLEQYIPEFMDGGFDDLDFLQDMTLEDLVTIGVTKPGHQRKIWMAVNALKGGDENGNMLEEQETTQSENVRDGELASQERKGYLETSLDGDDSGVSTDEVEPDNARMDDSEMEFPPPPLPLREIVSKEPFVEDSSSAESEIPEHLPFLITRRVDGEESVGEMRDQADKVEETSSSNELNEKDNVKTAEDTSLRVNEMNTDRSTDSDDDEPPPRPPPPMENMDISFPIPDTTHENNSKGPVKSVKNMVMKENDRIRTFSLDSSFQRPKKPAAPPPVKPKSFKKPPPPALKPKPRKAASFSGPDESSLGVDNGGDRSSVQSLPPTSPVDRRSSTGSNPFLCPSSSSSSGGNRQSGSGSINSRSSSASSQGSVESIIEEFEERKRSFERPGRKHSAPERLPTTCQFNGGRGSSPEDAARAEGGLNEKIKQILRPRSRENLSQSLPTESSVSPPLVPQIELESEAQAEKKENAQFAQVDDLMKDINNMLSDFSSELDSMFD